MQFIDLRSDTVTGQTPEMRAALLTADYGDHTYNEDLTVLKLEKMAAELLGKQAASFVPSGTFGNQCSILAAGTPGSEIILGDKSHIITFENGSVGKLSRMLTRTIECDANYFIPVKGLKDCLRKVKDNQAPKTTIFSIENPNYWGRIYPMDHFKQLTDLAKSEGLHIHMDGARVFNACAELKMEPKQFVKECSSVMFCLSKGLCTPVGSMVVGSKQFITKFNVFRKMLGGIMRKPGVIAELGIIALNTIRHELHKDHEIARTLGHKLLDLGWVQIVEKIELNRINFKFKDPRVKPAELQKFLRTLNIKVLFNPDPSKPSYVVTHHWIRQAQIEAIVSGFTKYYESIQNE